MAKYNIYTRMIRAGLIAVGAFVLLSGFVFVGSANAELAAVSPDLNAAGYPLWYQDNNGLALELCLDPANCIADPVDPANPDSVVLGVGGESFYWSADSAITDPASGVDGLLVMALEGAFLNEEPAIGEQIVFGRIRIRIDVPVAGVWTVDHPYGQEVFDVAAVGAGNEINDTSDIGCFAAPCDFSLALTSGVGPFLAAVDPPPPEGFIGNGLTEATIQPGPNGAAFRIRGPGGIDLTQNLFVVQGKIFTGATPQAPASVARATFARTTTDGQVDVFATAPVGSVVEVSGAPNLPSAPVPMVGNAAGEFFATIPLTDASVLPLTLTVTVDPLGTPNSVNAQLKDVVSISSAVYNPASQTLDISASSSDQGLTPPTLTAEGFGPLVSGSLSVPNLVVPPAVVKVTSSAGGENSATVVVASASAPPTDGAITVDRSVFQQRRGRLVLSGTATVQGAGEVIAVFKGSPSLDNLIGVARVNRRGAWKFNGKVDFAPGDTVSVRSVGGATLPSVEPTFR